MTDGSFDDLEAARLEPPESGSAGTQLARATADTTADNIVAPVIYESANLGAALHDYVDVPSAVVSTIAYAAFADSQERVKTLTSELKDARRTTELSSEKFHSEHDLRIVSGAALTEIRRTSWIEKAGLVVGGTVLGAGGSLILQHAVAQGCVLLVLGALFVVLALALGHRKGDA